MKPTSNILQIVPRLPPYSDGVGDYAILLAKQLASNHNIQTDFVTFCPGTETPATVDGFTTHRLFEHTTQYLLSLISKDVDGVLLHYSNYPYLQGMLDAPFWLVEALQQIQQRSSCPLVVMYHELPTVKWKQLRVLNPIQSLVSKRLSKIASAVFTDSHHFKSHLEKWTNAPITCIPDFSTIGEPSPSQVKPLCDRQRRVVIFGGSDRARAYRDIDNLLETCKALDIREICDIGTKQNLPSESFGDITFTEMGFQSAIAVQEILLDSVAGYLDYSRFPGDLGKSSVFAAFCAHGVMPICTAYNPSEPDGVFAAQHYAVAGRQLSTVSAQQCQRIADNALAWYAQHSLGINAERFASCLQSNREPSRSLAY